MNNGYSVNELTYDLVARTLSWLNSSSLKQAKNISKDIKDDPVMLQKYLYEEWCKSKIKAKYAE